MNAPPLGLHLALEQAISIEQHLEQGGGFRVSSATLLDAYIPLPGVQIEYSRPLDDAWRQTCPEAVSAAAGFFLEKRRSLLDLAGPRSAALRTLESNLEEFVAQNPSASAEYVAAYTSLLEATSAFATSSVPSVPPALVNLDLAYWFVEGRVRRARLLALHPLRFVRALAALELGVDVGDVPHRLAVWHGAEQMLYPDGRPGFFGYDARINASSSALVGGIREGVDALWPDTSALTSIAVASVTLLDVVDGVAAINALVDAAEERLRMLGSTGLAMRIDVRFARSPNVYEMAAHVPAIDEVSARTRAALLEGRVDGLAVTLDPTCRAIEEIGPADLLVAGLRCPLGRRANPDRTGAGLRVAYMAGRGGMVEWYGVVGSNATTAYARIIEALGLEAQHRAWQRPSLSLASACARVAVVASRVWPESIPPGWALLKHAQVDGQIVGVFCAAEKNRDTRASSSSGAEVQAALENMSLRFYAARGVMGRGVSTSDVSRALNLLGADEADRRASPTLVLSLDTPEGRRWLESATSVNVGADRVAVLIIEADDESADVKQIRAVVASPFVLPNQLNLGDGETALRLAAKVEAAFAPTAPRVARTTLLHVAWMEAARQRCARTFEAVLHALEWRMTNGASVQARAEWWLLPPDACASWQVTEAAVRDEDGIPAQVRVIAPAGVSVQVPDEPAIAAPEERAEEPAPSSAACATAPREEGPASHPSEATWPSDQLRRAVEEAAGASGVDDSSLACAMIRRVVAYRRAPLRHHLLAEVRDLIAPVLHNLSAAADLVDNEIQALVDLGDLVERREGDRAQLRIQASSACVLRIGGPRGRLVLLGRAEDALPKRLLEMVRCAGRLRAIDAGARVDEVENELRFFQIAPVDFDSWAQLPDEVKAPQLLQGMSPAEVVKPDALPSCDVFEPLTPPSFYVGRFVRGSLLKVLERDGWAAARSKEEFAPSRYFLFRLVEGKITRCEVKDRSSFLRLAAACAARSSGGRRFLARREAGTLRLYFPPPMWLARMLLLGERIAPGDALEAAALGEDVIQKVVDALERRMFCEVARS